LSIQIDLETQLHVPVGEESDHAATAFFLTAQKTYPLEYLLPSDVLQSTIQVFDLGHNILNFALVRALDVTCSADCHVNRELNAANF
jgi:hypothetical protein